MALAGTPPTTVRDGIVVLRRDNSLRSDENIVADCDSALILELTARVDEHALADLGVLPVVRKPTGSDLIATVDSVDCHSRFSMS